MTRAPAELYPNRHRRGYWAPGNYWRFRDMHARASLEENRAELAELRAHRPRVGISWPRSNYFRALEDTAREQEIRASGKRPRDRFPQTERD